MKTNVLYFGNNLQVLRDRIPDDSVDLHYSDPPFNANRNFFVLFKDRTGKASAAQEEAFTDTWSWTDESERDFREIVIACPNRDLATTVEALRAFLKETPMMAYLVSMSLRLVEMHRTLKPTGSFYLHCDSTASHYLKIILDTIFGPLNFRNEIIWKRTNVHSDSKTWSRVSDTIFFYTKSSKFTWNAQYLSHGEEYRDGKYRHKEADGRVYRLGDMTSPNPRPNLMYEWNGHASPPKGWRFSRETMARLDTEGRIWYPDDKAKRPQLKRFLDEMSGTLVGNVWTDINPINAQAAERLGYPTQKPLALLNRIIAASSNEGDLVMDCYCGCGTTVTAGHALKRKWVGIDVTAVSIGIIKSRLEQVFDDLKGKVPVEGFPQDFESARQLFEIDPYLFQVWACTLIDAYPLTKKGADGGIDGWLNFLDAHDVPHRAVVQVKGGKVQVGLIRDFAHVVAREKASLGFFICMGDVTKPMRDEAVKEGFWTSAGGNDYPKVQILTVGGLLAGTERAKLPEQDKRSMLGYKAKRQAQTGGQAELFGEE